MADVVGYSRLMEHDEAGTHERLRAIRETLIDSKISEHGGRTVDTAGDGMLLEFPSATAALRCAVEVQREMGTRNLYVPPDEQIQFRVGINLGDVIVEGERIIGDGVNVAARIETLAEPGGISVGSAVWEQVHDDLGIEFIDSGEQYVKNITKPVRVYRIALSKGTVAGRPSVAPLRSRQLKQPNRPSKRALLATGAVVALTLAGIGLWQLVERPRLASVPVASLPPPRSLMVVPFSAPAADMMLDKLAETLGIEVSRALANSVREAQIVPAGVATAYKGKPVDARVVGREVNVRYLVEGEVRAAADDVSVTVHLTDTVLAQQTGSEVLRMTRAQTASEHDLLIARLTSATRRMFWNAEGRRIAAEPLTATDARSLVDRADAVFTGEDLATTRAARKLYTEAINKDPGLTSAWLGRSRTYSDEHWSNFSEGRNPRLLRDQDRDTLRALALDSLDARAWQARANALSNQWQYDAAFEANDRARALDPTRFNLVLQRALLFILIGHAAEALETIEMRNAMVGSPDSDFLLFACHAHVHLGQFRDAIAKCGRAAVNGNDYWIYLDLTAAYAQTGDMVRAEAAKVELMRLAPDFSISRLEQKQFSNNPKWTDEIRTNFIVGLRKAGVPE